MNTPFDPIISEIRQHVYQVSVNYWLRRKSVYSSFIDSPNFRHIGIVSYSHSKGTTPFHIKLLHGKKNKKSVRPCGTEYRAGSRTVQKQEAVPPIIIESALCIAKRAFVYTYRSRPIRPFWMAGMLRAMRSRGQSHQQSLRRAAMVSSSNRLRMALAGTPPTMV